MCDAPDFLSARNVNAGLSDETALRYRSGEPWTARDTSPLWLRGEVGEHG
jgi:hypothetical protein